MTFELGNYDPVTGTATTDTLMTGGEVLAYDRAGILAAMDERTLRDEARKIIEERHAAKNAVLKDLPARKEARWLDDPSGRHQYRFFDGTQWTDDVSDKGVQSKDEYSG